MENDSHLSSPLATPGFATRCVHAGETLDSQGGIHAPLYNHSTFGFPNTKALLDVVEGRREGNLYTRYGLNPTVRAVEKKLAVAFLLARSLRTLPVRVKAQNAAAQAVAEFLQDHPQVVKVNYPGLPKFAGHEIARRQMTGYGGMVSFVYYGSAEETTAMVDRLKVFTIAASLGGVESLVTQPITTIHHGMIREERDRRGIPDGMVRLSCGLEDVDDLIADLRQALEIRHAAGITGGV